MNWVDYIEHHLEKVVDYEDLDVREEALRWAILKLIAQHRETV